MRHITAAALVPILLLAIAARAAPQAELWERWTRHDPASQARIDHRAWDELLDAYVVPGEDGIHRVRYAAMDGAPRERLEGYLRALQEVPISRRNRAEQQAYWINLYNALTVKVVLDHYPVDSIRDIDISPGLFSDGPWGKKLVEVEGERLSLDDIEHRILRPIWQDPRVHYAVNCAALGCPNLATDAFTAGNSDRLMEAGARAYVNHPRGVDIAGGELTVSSIYVWFQEDFGGDDAGVLAHLRRHAEPALRERLGRFEQIDDDRYDWGLNDAR